MATYHFGDGGPGFPSRHIGPTRDEQAAMLKTIHKGVFKNVDDLITKAVPKGIRLQSDLALPEKLSEHEALIKLRALAQQNKVFKSFIGQGYYEPVVPGVIQRNILENPGWYTQYTPYQSEIAQGRLEALINFQTMVADLTGLALANASLLDEATAAAEAMALAFAQKSRDMQQIFFVDRNCFAQTIGVVQTRAEPLGIEVVVGDPASIDFEQPPFGLLLQYPAKDGAVLDHGKLIESAKARGVMVIMAADLMSLALLKSPGELGADIAIGNTQRFGVPMGYGGPHAAYFATRDEFKRKIPGRIIGYSQDSRGKPALRMALQTREQHIRRDKATSNICTSQVLLAIMASMYAVYHGPEGVRHIATVIHQKAKVLARGLKSLGLKVSDRPFFDTVTVSAAADTVEEIRARMVNAGINLHFPSETSFSIAIDEATTDDHLESLLGIFANHFGESFDLANLAAEKTFDLPASLLRRSTYLTHPVFNSHHSETKMLRYIRKLESRDLSLTRSMIPLGSCTMKLNATAELYPITWPEFANLHPFAPKNQAMGYAGLVEELEDLLAKCTGFDAISLQPNSGAQGEYAGLLVIRKFHQVRGENHRQICLIPKSAHGTNPASAVMAGMTVVVVACDDNGNIDLQDLEKKAEQYKDQLAALMVTYPSTHGVFEEEISTICEIVHRVGGQVYMDGANLNAQIGLCKPGEYGPDVCHLNLHKTFCIPHGGGGPGMGPIGVKKHLAPFLPNHPVVMTGGDQGIGPVSAAPWGSTSILPISLMYIWMMGEQGLTDATKVAILNANYIADRLQPHFPVLYRGVNGLVAHECIVDVRQLKVKTGIEVEDIAKRLMDYGFHAPTVSFPVPGTLMIEPTESEAQDEMDRFCDAMIAIRQEIAEIEAGKADRENNVLKNAPHTADILIEENWDRPYSREKAVFPTEWTKDFKFWPSVGRVDNAYGDRNLMCACLPIDAYES